MTHNEKFLRKTLGADSILCAGSGSLLLVAAGPLVGAGDLPTSATWPLRAAGIALLALAVLLHRLARSDEAALTKFVPYSAEADTLWAIGSIVFAAVVQMNGPARAVVIAQALTVGAVGAVKMRGLRRMTGRGGATDALATAGS